MIRTIIGVVLLIWLIGLIAHVGGAFIHFLLLLALIIFVYDQFIARKRA